MYERQAEIWLRFQHRQNSAVIPITGSEMDIMHGGISVKISFATRERCN
jgi:hypothetical protein